MRSLSEKARPTDTPPDEAPEGTRSSDSLPGALEASRREVEGLVTRLKYLQAEFENFRKRAAKEAEATMRYAQESLLVRLLPVLDELDAAVQASRGDIAEGVRMVRDNLLKVLEDAGLREIPAEGRTFDPYVHEAVERVPDPDLPEGTVKQVLRKGYRLEDRVLRPAQVIVVKQGGDVNGENHRN